MAQGTYTISGGPVKSREYTNKHGTDLTVWRLGLENAQSAAEDGWFELHKKKAPPQEGEEIEVERTIEGEFDGQKFTRLFLVDTYQQKQQGGGGGSSAGKQQGDGPGLKWKSAPFERGAEHPRNEARAIHTSSLASTPAYLNSLLAFGAVDGDTLKPTDKWDAYWKLVGKVATKLTRSYEAAMEPQQQQLPVVEQEVPADTDGLEPQPRVADDKIPF